jgi:uncharacterized membrane protein
MNERLIAGLVFFAGICIALLLRSPAAQASLQLCNQSNAKVYAAVAYHDNTKPAASEWFSEGWWTIQPGGCVTPLSGPLRVRYVYVYGETEGYTRTWTGSNDFCTVTDEFEIWGAENDPCTGGTLRHFIEVDTGNANDYTYTFQ